MNGHLIARVCPTCNKAVVPARLLCHCAGETVKPAVGAKCRYCYLPAGKCRCNGKQAITPRYDCTRPAGHAGDCVACHHSKHHFATWPKTFASKGAQNGKD